MSRGPSMGWIRTVVISAVLGALTVVGVTAIGATAAGRLIEACVHRSNGNVRIVAANQSCRNSEVPLTWNQKGPAGATGPAGPKGDRGPQGPTGAAGPAGPKGETGPLGPVGPQGPAGAQGIPGEAGPQGPQGAQGVQGETGPAGPQGEKGETGPAGPQGETGPQGPQGEKGDMGPVGPAGPEGEAGPQGPQGPPGPAGGGAAISFITRSITSISVPRNTTDYQRSIACSDGEVVVGGGFSTNNNVEVYRSMPNTMNGWSVLFKNPTNTLYGASIYVICADMP